MLIWTCLLATALAADPPDPRLTSLESFEKTLRKATKRRADTPLVLAWAPWAAATGRTLDDQMLAELHKMLRKNMKGEVTRECRGELCRLSYARGDETFAIVLRPSGDTWVVHDPQAAIGRLGAQVSARFMVYGPCTARVEINGSHTFLVDDLRDTDVMISALDDALVSGVNTLTLRPLDLAEGDTLQVEIRLGTHAPGTLVDTAGSDLLSWMGPLDATQSWTFDLSGRRAPMQAP